MDIKLEVENIQDGQCVVDTLLKLVSSHKCLGCGKCVFGYEGALQIQLMLKDMTEKKSHSDDLQKIEKLAGFMKTQSLCEDGVFLAEAIQSAIGKYRDDFIAHISKKGCPAGVCKKFLTYHILADKCTGCGDCIDACEEDAILGKRKFVHVIELDECTSCGDCLEACDDDAIVTAGLVKPRGPKKPIPCKR